MQEEEVIVLTLLLTCMLRLLSYYTTKVKNAKF